jgi:Carboxypeptidase regulatory-like domain/TonB-dependent Receptor Plug Domain
MQSLSAVRTVIFVLLFGVVLPLEMQAQNAAVSGTITDSTGAVVSGVQVTVRNLATNLSRSTSSSATGAYSVTNLEVGAYEITAKKDGFRTFHLPSLDLTVAHVSTVDAELLPGAASEEVTVRGDSMAPIDFETSQVSNLVDQEQMKDLPLITRDPYSLVLLSPGTSQTNTGLGGFTINGSRERNNNFLLDGVDNNDTSVPGIPDGVLSANPDSTEEFRVITNNFNAEYGRNTGAIIEVVTKSGTNKFHGGAYEYGRWNSFGGARDWFNPAIDSTGASTRMNPYVRNQFGYSIGGPIIKDKTFFFFNQEFDRFRTTLTNSATVPTQAFKNGVFNYTTTDLNSASPQFGQQVTVPVDLTAAGANNGAFGAPLDPTMRKVFGLFPNPTVDNGDGFTGTLFFPSASKQNSYSTVAKVDHHFTDRETVSIRYGYDDFYDPNPGHNDILPGNVGGVDEKAINQGLGVNLISTLSNNVVNNFNFGWNRIYSRFDCTGISTLDSVIPATDQFGNGWDFNMDPFTSVGCLALVSDGQWRKTGTTSYGDNLTWVHGAHTFKFGGDFRNVGEQGPNSFFSRRQVGLQSFLNAGVALAANVTDASGFDVSSVQLQDAASAYYGFAWQDFNAEFFNKAGARTATDQKHFRQHEYDWFGQDTWKVRRNLTLTLGLRYQLDGVPYEENANFSNLLESPTSAPPLTMSIVGPGTGNQLYKSDYSNIEPRVGFSWDPTGKGKMAVRGAFGIFHDRVFGNLFGNARGNPPFEQDYVNFPFETVNNYFGSGAFPLPSVPQTIPSPVIPDGAALAPVLFDTHFRNTGTNNWSLGIQRELGGNNVIDVSYVGAEGHHIYREVDGNPPDPALVQQLLTICSSPTNPLNTTGCTTDDVIKTNLYLGKEFGVLPFDAVAHNALVQPFYQVSVGNSIYNSLQAKFTHRMSHGLQVQGAYTWSHGIDDSSDPLVEAIGNRGFPRNSLDLHEERGNSDNDIRQVAVVNYIWDTPFGRGKTYLRDGVVGKIFEGIQFAGITTVQTGHPFDVFSTTDMERTGLSGRADLVPGQNPYATGSGPGFNTPANSAGTKIWFSNTNAFSGRSDGSGAPLFDGPGNIGRNHFYGPGFVDFDLAFSKSMKFTERINAQLRVEAYNIFNHPHFNNPGSDINVFGNQVGSPIFGLITSTAQRPDSTTSARQMQVALKVNF